MGGCAPGYGVGPTSSGIPHQRIRRPYASPPTVRSLQLIWGPRGSGPWVGWELLRADVTNHQRQWFRTTDIHSLPILAATNPKSRRQQGWLLLEALGAKRPAASGSGGRWQPFAFRSGRCLGLLPASHFTWPSAGSLVPPSPYQDAGCWVWGPHDIQEDPISRSLTQ